MAVIIKTSNPTELLASIKKSIDAKKIDTWSYDSEGDFTHTPEQWERKAWLRPRIMTGELRFSFLGSKEVITTKLLYAIFHGRFSEMILNHFDDKCSEVKATSMPIEKDVVTTKIDN